MTLKFLKKFLDFFKKHYLIFIFFRVIFLIIFCLLFNFLICFSQNLKVELQENFLSIIEAKKRNSSFTLDQKIFSFKKKKKLIW